MRIIDGKESVLGRLGSRVSKMLLSGESVTVVNAGEIVVSGNPKYLVEKYMARRNVKNRANPEHSPHWPRRPDLLVKRIIRGMLPYDSARGRGAFKRLKVYMGAPESAGKPERLDGVDSKRLRTRTMTINELCSGLGYRVKV